MFKTVFKNIIFISILISVNFSFSRAEIGIGLNYPGIHLCAEIKSDIYLEGRIQSGADVQTHGLRIYRMVQSNTYKNLEYAPYFGGELSLISSKYLNTGILLGGFGGLEISLKKYLTLGIDGGFYVILLDSSIDAVADIGIIINTGLTYYFKRK